MATTLEPYRWYDPFEMAERADRDLRRAAWMLDEAEELERRTGQALNAMARAADYENRHLKTRNEGLMRAVSEIASLTSTPIFKFPPDA